mmetsp:Transcript_48008/g.84508  ORF Transcript_48008/g.84508 Transcript_48008/m.84508 type:complete len:97 (+) Transcript_48008:523-813(+)
MLHSLRYFAGIGIVCCVSSGVVIRVLTKLADANTRGAENSHNNSDKQNNQDKTHCRAFQTGIGTTSAGACVAANGHHGLKEDAQTNQCQSDKWYVG